MNPETIERVLTALKEMQEETQKITAEMRSIREFLEHKKDRRFPKEWEMRTSEDRKES